jgi:hypothetical protein
MSLSILEIYKKKLGYRQNFYFTIMGIAKFLAFTAAFAVLLACGEVGGGFEDKSGSSGSQNCTGKNCAASSSSANSSSSLNDFDIKLDLITQSQYNAVMGTNPSKGVKNGALPVEGVTWFNAVEFCTKLSGLMGLNSNALKLLTEAEWEKAIISGLIQRNAAYWEWTNDCWDSNLPNCLERDYKVRKGFDKKIEDRYATDPYSDNIGGGYISFRCSKRNF